MMANPGCTDWSTRPPPARARHPGPEGAPATRWQQRQAPRRPLGLPWLVLGLQAGAPAASRLAHSQERRQDLHRPLGLRVLALVWVAQPHDGLHRRPLVL